MSEKIQETQKKLKDLGYFASEDLAKIVLLFEMSGKRKTKSIPALLLQGKSGAGKTFLAETFSKMIDADEEFVQCFPRIGTENLQCDVNIEGYIKGEADNVVKAGILLRALQQSYNGPVVLVIDELDKARPEVDSFLLDFLENGRLTTGTDTYMKGSYPIYTCITTNGKREIDDALVNRCRMLEVPRPSKKLFLEILGLSEKHYLAWIYDKCPNFSIRQAKHYLEDLEVLGVPIDEQALSQYINLDELYVSSVADIQYMADIEHGNLEFELSDLDKCDITINSYNQQGWGKIFLEDGNKDNFELYSNEGNLYVRINTIEQLQMASNYMTFDKYHNRYAGWFEYSLSDEEMKSNNIRWATNTEDGTRFGVKIIDENTAFRIAANSGHTFLYLDSGSDKTLERFLGQPKVVANRSSEFYDDDYDFDESEEH